MPADEVNSVFNAPVFLCFFLSVSLLLGQRQYFSFSHPFTVTIESTAATFGCIPNITNTITDV